MSETQTLLSRISALRQRLDQAQLLAGEARSAASSLIDPATEQALDEVVSQATLQHNQSSAVVRPVNDSASEAKPMTLTTQAREVIARGRQVLSQLRELGSAYDSTDESNPLTVFYDDTVSMMDTAMRTVALLPQAASGQSYICRGLDVMLTEIYDRLRTLEIGHERRRRRIQDIGTLGEILSELQTNQTIHTVDLERFAERIIEQVELGHPIDFIHESPEYPQAFAAAHGLTTAQVMARLVKFDPEMRMHSVSAIVASLVHDVGMLSVPPEVLMTSGSLEGEARRKVESHTTTGARWVLPLFRDAPWLVEAVAGHHERLDGSGYPDGAKGDNVKPFTRLLAVCDVYAAMMVPRPHRPARSSRTALADTLMMADQGLLDRRCGAYLLRLSFYPVGTAVELSSGAAAVVVATPSSLEMTGPSRPVVAVLTDADGEPLATPRHLDLAQTEAESIVRPLSPGERTKVLSRRLARWAA